MFEIVEPLRTALRELRELAESVSAAREPANEYEQFARWLEQLRATFRAVDAIWPSLGDALFATPIPASNKRRPKESR